MRPSRQGVEGVVSRRAEAVLSRSFGVWSFLLTHIRLYGLNLGLRTWHSEGADDQDLINGARIFQGACFAYHLLNLGDRSLQVYTMDF